MKNLLSNSRLLSKWIILFIDMIIVGWSFSVSYFIARPLGFSHVSIQHFTIYLTIYSVLSFAVYSLMGIHTGIIRYSNTTDIYKIFIALFLTTSIFGFLIVYVMVPFYHFTPIIQTVLFINFSVCCTAMIMLRIAVKAIFSYLQVKRKLSKEICLIYGSDKASILIKQALESCSPSTYYVAGFIDDNRNRVSKYIEQKKVFNIKDLTYIKAKLKITKIMIVSNHMDSEAKKSILETCVKLNIKVITMPPAYEWVNGELSLSQLKELKIEDLLQREPIYIETENILEQLSGKSILITGAAGSIGSEIARQAISFYPEQLILCDHAESPLHELQMELEREHPNLKLQICIGSVKNQNRMRQLFTDFEPQLVFHGAAYKHVPMMENNPSEAVLTNVLGTKIIADLCVEFKVEKFVMISTDKAVNPTNVMGATKRIAELYIQYLSKKDCPTRFITTRFGNVLGSNGSVIPRFRSQIERGGPVTVTHPEITRYFMTIPEAVQLVMEACAMGKGGEIFIFDMGQPVKIIDLARQMISLSGFVPDKDIKIVYTGLRPGEKLYEELLNKDEENIPTHHYKIKVSIASNYCADNLLNLIKQLFAAVKVNNSYGIVKKMKEIVPEFISNNSKFETLDNQFKLIN